MKRHIRIGLLVICSVILLSACSSGKTDFKNEVSETDKEKSLPTYSFAVEGYVEIQEGEIDSVNVTDYLPDRSMTLTYEQLDENKAVIPGLRTIHYVEPYYDEDNKVEYRTELPQLTPNEYLGGCFYYDDKADCLANKMTGGSDTAYLIPMGKSLTTHEGVSIQNATYLFTVTTDSGKYEDCVCVLDTDKSTDKEVLHAIYYAKGIGEVLTTTNYLSDNEQDFQVSSMLVSLEAGLNIGNSNDEDIPSDDSVVSNEDITSEELDLPDKEQIEYAENGSLTVEEIQKCLPGDYQDNDGSELSIADNGDKTYSINIAIFRLASFENCAGYFDAGSIYFTGKDPNEELISGYIDIADSSDKVRVVFTDSKWTLIEDYSSYEYYRVK